MATPRLLPALALLAACTGSPSAPPPAESPGESAKTTTPDPEPVHTSAIDLDDPQACAGCHGTVVQEWETSMHARSHHDKDPVYAGMRSLRMDKQGQAIAGKCAQCHNPRDPASPDSAAGRAGVSCATCHHLAAVDASGEKKGAGALTFAQEPILRGPHDITSQVAPHGVGEAAPWLTDGKTVCLACHGQMKNPQGAVTCNTGPEHAEAGAEPCTSCHMPTVSGPSGAVSQASEHRSHAFLGGHTLYQSQPDPAFMASAVAATLTRDGTSASLTLRNTAGHHVPSAFPGRMVLVKVVGLDAQGESVWSNFTDDPMSQDPQAVLNTVYVDQDDKPILPPFAARKARDSRLAAGESRTLTWTVPDTVVKTRATLLYRLVPPPAVQPLGLSGRPEAEPRPFATIEESDAP